MNDKKQPDGFDIAMIKEIGKRMDKKVEIQNMEFKSLIGAMESNSINTIIAGMTKTKERQKSVDFSDSYYTSNQAIILKKDSKIKKLSQLEGKKVGVQEGTTGDIIASGEKFGEKNKVIVKTDVKRYKKGVDAVMDLKNGAIDAVVIDDDIDGAARRAAIAGDDGGAADDERGIRPLRLRPARRGGQHVGGGERCGKRGGDGGKQDGQAHETSPISAA